MHCNKANGGFGAVSGHLNEHQDATGDGRDRPIAVMAAQRKTDEKPVSLSGSEETVKRFSVAASSR